ncbi:hypothetical protein BD410DRAFT_781340 [Rickenella mellea]|uniref:Uncharacterized protein n=1 Tax=Rickenella mellea TaxID=50990 RepID=A0A4Y7QP07_9AGAM|nr:hypothetical protein BD410DRAFT_781340 [Rickenella mellea]
MNPNPSPSDNTSLSHSYPHHLHIDPAMRSLLASTWQVLDQPPPPTLREILGAYKSKGDGDREMLLAMLNAKSAEDQRIASMASLHRTMLDIHQTTSPHIPQLNLPDPTRLPPLSPHGRQGIFSSSQSRPSPSSSPKVSLPAIRDHPNEDGPRKRMRTSESPPAPPRHNPDNQVASHNDLPPSPYSSTSKRSMSADSSHSSQQRGAMAIGSLLSSNEAMKESDENWSAQLSSERSSTRAMHERASRGHNHAAVSV